MPKPFQDLAYMFLIIAVFPGFFFTAVCGLASSWIDRKVTARVQWRTGPPWYQPLADILKLLGKETILPESARRTGFFFAPIIGLAGVTLLSTLLWCINLNYQVGFVGDLIVVLYLLLLPPIGVILGGSSSANPFGAVGASREMSLLLGYELPFLLSLGVVIIKSGLNIDLENIMNAGPVVGSISGVLAFIVAILCVQAKLTVVPFDCPEAECEVMEGPYIEYSGTPLAIIKLTRAMMLFTLPIFLITVYLGGFGIGADAIWGVLKYVGILALIVVIRNTNPRVRIDQAVRFFWGPVTFIAGVALILALLGL